MTADGVLMHGDVVEQLLASVPEIGPEVREHFDDYGELLLHLLMPDLLRAAVRLFHAGELEIEQRLLRFIDLALRHGAAAVENAVLVSFVEHAGAFPEETPEFLASWPAGVRQIPWPPQRAVLMSASGQLRGRLRAESRVRCQGIGRLR